MVKEKDEVVLQKVQQPNAETPSAIIPGFNTRPFNQRTQVTNVYLDSCFVGGHATITGVAVGADPFTVAIPFDMNDIYLPSQKEGKLNWVVDTNGYIVIPKDGTYILNGMSQFVSTNTDIKGISTRLSFKLADLVTTGYVYQSSKYRLLTDDAIPFSQVQNLKKGDRFKYYSGHSVIGVDIPIYEYLSITLIS